MVVGKPTKGEQTREFNFVDNIIDGLILAASHPGKVDGVMNLAGGEEIEIRNLVNKIAELTETRSRIEIGALPYRPTEIWRMFADSSRARNTIGWQPRVRLEDGLKQTVSWFREYYRDELSR